MYDKRLDLILRIAQLGSFSKAAQEIGYSIPALIRKVDAFEDEVGFEIFERSNKGTEITPSGEILIDEAKLIIDRCNAALQKAKQTKNENESLVRVGVSRYHSGQPILELLQNVFICEPNLQIQLISVDDTYESYKQIIEHLGESIDVLPSSLLPIEYESCYQMEVLGNPFLCFAVSLKDELAVQDSIALSELNGRRILIPKKGESMYVDAARSEIAEQAKDVTFVEFSHYTHEIFNRCAMQGDVLLSKEIWDGVHPLLKSIRVEWDKTIPYCLYFECNPRKAVQGFVTAAKEAALKKI